MCMRTDEMRTKAATSVWIALTRLVNPREVLLALKTIIIHCRMMLGKAAPKSVVNISGIA
eukprot:11433646-Heterocapsa_arctica.AAC.1